ncbi:oligoribonuclease [Ectothiorhodospiraceae bacterium BW-2]|nr:oligoribonuclease [Ectothiorhodospiraceae bacterium BW-2]
MSESCPYLGWIDLEMTGLVPEQDTIMEIATLITDTELNEVAEGPVLAIQHTPQQLERMDSWCQHHHGQSGLSERVVQSRVTLAEAEQQSLAFLQRYLPRGSTPLCGNSIWQDRRFLVRYMPQLEQWFHYRNIDVSSIKELAKRWAPQIAAGVKKRKTHLALDDIRESIEELRYYRRSLFSIQ